MDKYEAFKRAYADVPSQDNEGYTPDRGSFKTGFLSAWDIQQKKIDELQERVREAEKEQSIEYVANLDANREIEELKERLKDLEKASDEIDAWIQRNYSRN